MRIDKTFAFAVALAGCMALLGTALAQDAPVPPKPAMPATKAANQQVQKSLPFSFKQFIGLDKPPPDSVDLQVIDPALNKMLDPPGRLKNVDTAMVAGLRLYVRF
jgi:hypothetical protein